MTPLRPDLELISEWIEPGSRVLDLGCGDGTLLKHLAEHRGVSGYGLEIEPENIVRCIRNGVDVIQSDLDEGLSDYFDDDSFDYVVMTQTLQAVHYPAWMLKEMLRVGREGIVTFPNFGHWRSRMQIALGGHMPKHASIPYEWYDTPNIHFCTFQDFEELCRHEEIRILDRCVADYLHRSSLGMKLLPNLLGEMAIYRFTKG
ncbi:methionine biosynthesis protein MetW [Endothiovibrio diazotrophicus]